MEGRVLFDHVYSKWRKERDSRIGMPQTQYFCTTKFSPARSELPQNLLNVNALSCNLYNLQLSAHHYLRTIRPTLPSQKLKRLCGIWILKLCSWTVLKSPAHASFAVSLKRKAAWNPLCKSSIKIAYQWQ